MHYTLYELYFLITNSLDLPFCAVWVCHQCRSSFVRCVTQVAPPERDLPLLAAEGTCNTPAGLSRWGWAGSGRSLVKCTPCLAYLVEGASDRSLPWRRRCLRLSWSRVSVWGLSISGEATVKRFSLVESVIAVQGPGFQASWRENFGVMDLIQSSVGQQHRQQVLGHWRILLKLSWKELFCQRAMLKKLSIDYILHNFCLVTTSVSKMQTRLTSQRPVGLSPWWQVLHSSACYPN